jgi:uncharacterized protein DUF5666
MSDVQHGPIDEAYEEGGWGRLIAIALVVVVVIAAGAFFAGKATAGGSSGPSTLADAIQQAQQGKLSCGDVGAAVAAGQPTGTGQGNGGGVPNAGGFLARGLCGRDAGTQAQGAPGAGQGRPFGGGLTGQVTAVSGSSLTVNTPAGSRTVKLGPSTEIDRTAKAGASDLRAGLTVTVSGANGSGAATRVLIVPARQSQ